MTKRVHYVYHCYYENGDLAYVGRSCNPERRHKEAMIRYGVVLRLWLGSSTYSIDKACKMELAEIRALSPPLNKYLESTRSMYGRHHSAESKARMSATRKGRVVTLETRKKLSESKMGVSYGPHTSAHNAKIGRSLLGQKRGKYSVEHRRKISEAHLHYHAMLLVERQIEEGLLNRR